MKTSIQEINKKRSRPNPKIMKGIPLKEALDGLQGYLDGEIQITAAEKRSGGEQHTDGRNSE